MKLAQIFPQSYETAGTETSTFGKVIVHRVISDRKREGWTDRGGGNIASLERVNQLTGLVKFSTFDRILLSVLIECTNLHRIECHGTSHVSLVPGASDGILLPSRPFERRLTYSFNGRSIVVMNVLWTVFHCLLLFTLIIVYQRCSTYVTLIALAGCAITRYMHAACAS